MNYSNSTWIEYIRYIYLCNHAIFIIIVKIICYYHNGFLLIATTSTGTYSKSIDYELELAPVEMTDYQEPDIEKEKPITTCITCMYYSLCTCTTVLVHVLVCVHVLLTTVYIILVSVVQFSLLII